MNTQMILRLGKCGTPIDWVSLDDAANMIAKESVSWSFGEPGIVLRGGVGRSGKRSLLTVPAVLATKGNNKAGHITPALCNAILFRRDRCLCMYCGKEFETKNLSRDHIIPRGQGGLDVWQNVITACKRCNHRKGCRTPEQAEMELLAVPYAPNIYEYLVLRNKSVLTDQMDFLKKGFSKNFR